MERVLLSMIVIVILLCTVFLIVKAHGQPVENDVQEEIPWNNSFNLTDNFTVKTHQKLVIMPGVEVSLGLDVSLIVEGEIHCRSASFINTGERLSGGIILENCVNATFVGTDFISLALGIEVIYSELILDNCSFENNGVGLFSFQSRVEMTNCSIIDCDMAARFVRSNITVSRCSFTGNVQSMMIHNELYLIESFYRFELGSVEDLNGPVSSVREMNAVIENCVFRDTGVGVSAISIEMLILEKNNFEMCKKGFYAKMTGGRICGCSFQQNKMDFEVIGSGLVIHENITSPQNYIFFITYKIKIIDPFGNPLSGIAVLVSHPVLGEETYRTDADGSVPNLTVLAESVSGGIVKKYTGYHITVGDLRFQGYYPLTQESSVVISPSDMVRGRVEETQEPVGRAACFLVVCLLLTAGIAKVIRKRIGKKKI